MLHPSYTELMKLINEESEDDSPVVNSRYSIVMATAKRARQIIAGEANVSRQEALKPLSTAVAELQDGLIHILPSDADAEDKREIAEMASKFIDSSSLSVGASLDSDDELEDSDDYADEYDSDSEDEDDGRDDEDEDQE